MRAVGSIVLILVLLSLSAFEPASGGTTLIVSAASSLQDVVRSLAREYETRYSEITIRVNSGSSRLLARQIEEGAPVDLFLSADDLTIRQLVDQGRIDSAGVVALAMNRVVIVASAGDRRDFDEVADLASPSVHRIALCDSTVPIGRYGAAFLRAADLEEALIGRTVRTENARASLAAAITGAVDLAFVYETDLLTTKRLRLVWRVDPLTIPQVMTFGGPVRRSGENRPEADAFLSFLRGPEAITAFRDAGFLPVTDDDL